MQTQAPTEKGVERSIGGKLKSTYVGIRTHWHSKGRLILGEGGERAAGIRSRKWLAGGRAAVSVLAGSTGNENSPKQVACQYFGDISRHRQTDRQRGGRQTDPATYATCNIRSFFARTPYYAYASPAESLPQLQYPIHKTPQNPRSMNAA